MTKPTLCLDFDGVLHSYTSGWKGPEIVADPPTPGAMQFIVDAIPYFQIVIYSSRSNSPGGTWAMKRWLADHLRASFATANDMLDEIQWATTKPSAMVTLDDRAITFIGEWPSIQTLLAFKPWNKK